MELLKRKIDDFLLNWKSEPNHKPLIVKGARQIGKTESIRSFARKNYKYIIEINFVLQKQYKDIFDEGFEVDTIIKNITLHDPSIEVIPNETLIFFDELQDCINCATSLKSFNQDKRYDVICSGSMMGINYNEIESNSVGNKEDYEMHSMDFEEFLWAMNEQPLIDVIRLSFDKKKAMGQALHRKAMTLFRQYVIVGGMPQAVNTYIETRSFEKTDEIKRDILSLYREDIAKHAKGYERKVESVFDEIPEQLSKHEKKFTLSSLGRGAKYRSYESSFLWLEDSMICNICYNSTAPNVGIKLNRDRNTLKLYMGDTGLLISHAFDENGLVKEEIYKKLLLGKLEVNEGMVFENVVAQMLTASGHKLYFYSNSSRENKDERMEIDFLIAKKDPTNRHNVSPIEVKSGKRYTYSSLGKFMNRFNAQLDVPYILHTADYAEKDGIVFIPVYWAWLL